MTTIAANIGVARPRAVSPKRRSRINLGRIAAHIVLLFFVALWTFPTVGLLVSSVRDKDQLAVSGWWTALTYSKVQNAARVGRASDQVEEGGAFVIKGNILGPDRGARQILSFVAMLE